MSLSHTAKKNAVRPLSDVRLTSDFTFARVGVVDGSFSPVVHIASVIPTSASRAGKAMCGRAVSTMELGTEPGSICGKCLSAADDQGATLTDLATEITYSDVAFLERRGGSRYLRQLLEHVRRAERMGEEGALASLRLSAARAVREKADLSEREREILDDEETFVPTSPRIIKRADSPNATVEILKHGVPIQIVVNVHI